MPFGRRQRVRRRRVAAAGAAGAYAVQMHNEREHEAGEQAAEPQPSDAPDPIARLTELKGLLDSGVLTQEEFDAEKQKVLNG